jgi:hypothetical protein
MGRWGPAPPIQSRIERYKEKNYGTEEPQSCRKMHGCMNAWMSRARRAAKDQRTKTEMGQMEKRK